MATAPVPREALIHDLAMVLAGVSRPDAEVSPDTHLAAHRLRGVLRTGDGPEAAAVESAITQALDGEQ